jgi:DNA primase
VQAIGAEAFKEKIQSAQSLVQFFTQNLAQQVNLSSPDGRAQLVALVRPYLKNIDNEPLRAALVQELKQITRLPQADLQRLLRGDSSQAQPQRETLQSTGLKPEVRRLFQYVLELPHLAQRVSNLQQLHDCEVVGVPLLARVIEFFQTEAEARAAELLAAWPVEAERALLLALSQAPLPAFEDRRLEAEFVQHIQGLQQRSLRQRALALIGRQGQLSEAEQQELLVLKASLR